jgi:hypothetical protein
MTGPFSLLTLKFFHAIYRKPLYHMPGPVLSSLIPGVTVYQAMRQDNIA